MTFVKIVRRLVVLEWVTKNQAIFSCLIQEHQRWVQVRN